MRRHSALSFLVLFAPSFPGVASREVKTLELVSQGLLVLFVTIARNPIFASLLNLIALASQLPQLLHMVLVHRFPSIPGPSVGLLL